MQKALFIFLFIFLLLLISIGWTKRTAQTQQYTAPSPSQTVLPIPLFTIDRIFQNDHTWINTLPKENIRVLIATGDVIPARSVNYKTLAYKNFAFAFEKTADVLKSADVTLINLETPLIANCPITVEGMQFCGDIRNEEGLRLAGVDVANLANNHIGDYGKEGVEQTVAILANAGILSSGVSDATYKEVKGIQFSFLGYNDISARGPHIAFADTETIRKEVRQARQKADVVVVSFHWGVEYTTQITQRQQKLGHAAIDAGADLVIGNHPHWIQPIEFYKGKLITYAHGNFVFDQMWSEETKKGVVGRYTFYENRLIDVEFLPLYIEDYGQPYFLDGEEKHAILTTMKKESVRLTVTSTSTPGVD